ncbi:MAG: TraR/DksA family transcriptional regulator [Phycisphaerae bacterium]|jgi:phage/conjugal plasmid C-4 type zinc finger TraR family protein
MGDIIDKAQENEELFRRNALKNHFAGKSSSSLKRTGKLKRKCKGCGEPIPKERLKANPEATRCVKCQENVEKNGEEFLDRE